MQDEFWVDLFLEPTPVPDRVNQTWDLLSEHGAVWGITANALPLRPDQTLGLTLDKSDPCLDTTHSRLPTVLLDGTQNCK